MQKTERFKRRNKHKIESRRKGIKLKWRKRETKRSKIRIKKEPLEETNEIRTAAGKDWCSSPTWWRYWLYSRRVRWQSVWGTRYLHSSIKKKRRYTHIITKPATWRDVTENLILKLKLHSKRPSYETKPGIVEIIRYLFLKFEAFWATAITDPFSNRTLDPTKKSSTVITKLWDPCSYKLPHWTLCPLSFKVTQILRPC